MKIAFFSEAYEPGRDGVSDVTYVLAKELSKKGHKVTIVAPWDNSEVIKKDGYKLVRVKGHSIKLYDDMRVCLKNPDYLETLEDFSSYDLIHLQSPATIASLGFFIALKHNIPLSCTYHTDIANFVGSFFEKDVFINQENPMYKFMGNKKFVLTLGKKILTQITWGILRNFHNAVPSTTSPSRFSKQQLREAGVRNPIFVINNPINPKLSKKNYSKKYDLKDKFVILHVGRLSVEKRVNILIESIAKLKKECPNVLGVITSKGPLANHYKKLAKKMGVEKNIIFTGHINKDELNWFYEKCDLFSAFGLFETFNICATQALFYGKPLILSDAGPHNELIEDNGYLIKVNSEEINNFSEKVKLVYSNPKLCKELGENSKNLWKKYDYNDSIAKHEEYFAKSIENNKVSNKNYFNFIKYLSKLSIAINSLLFSLSLKIDEFDKLNQKFDSFFAGINKSSGKLKKYF